MCVAGRSGNKKPRGCANSPGALSHSGGEARMRHGNVIVAEPPPARKAVAVNVLPREQQLEALSLLVEGVSLRSVTRLTGIHRTTVMSLMARTGRRLAGFL